MSTAKKTYIGMSKYREVWQRLGRSAVVLGCLALLLVAALSAQQARAARPAQDGETKTQGTESLPADESLSRAEAYLRRQSRAVSDAKGAGSAGGMVTLPAAPRSSKGQASPQAVQCSPDWVTVESDNDREGSTTLKGVAVHSATDVWAVGSYVGYVGNVATVRTHIIHWDGQTWSRVPSPNQGNGYNLLEAVTAVSSNDAWAVGEYMDVATNKLRTLTLHWNGTAWALVTSPNAGPGFHLLLGVAQAGPDNVWAVGYYVNSSGVDRTFIMQWNGSSWGIATSANQGAEDNKLRGISVVPGSGGAVIWAVGVYEDASSHDHALFERYSSGSWSVVAGADLGAGSISDLSAVAAISATDIWATGTYSANSNFVP
ncbi:MAG: hypothetical protein QOH93_1606, partial [Chloroflexia bacterium]|nr:hypothetical protein [Chloroflexia bacterium]